MIAWGGGPISHKQYAQRWASSTELFRTHCGDLPITAQYVYMDDGSTFCRVLTASGNTVNWAGKFAVAGEQYQLREPFLLASDLEPSKLVGR